MQPLVSVITPTYNAAAFVRETVESVLAQTYGNVEHILVDDASTDATPDVLRELGAANPERIRLVLCDDRAGPCRRRNDALEVASGSLVAWLDHDDVWTPTKLERQVREFAAADVALVFSQYEEFESRSHATVSRSELRNGTDLYRRLFVEGCFIAASTVVFSRAAMDRRTPRLRDSDFSFGDDYALWLALLLEARGVLVDDVLARLRRHDANESARIARRNYHLDRIAILEEHLRAYSDATRRLGAARRRGLAAHYAAAARYEFERGRRAAGLRMALEAARRRPAASARYLAGSARAALRRRVRQT